MKTIYFFIGIIFFLSTALSWAGKINTANQYISDSGIIYNFRNLNDKEKSEALRIISQTESLLPKKLKETLSGKITVQFKELNKSENLEKERNRRDQLRKKVTEVLDDRLKGELTKDFNKEKTYSLKAGRFILSNKKVYLEKQYLNNNGQSLLSLIDPTSLQNYLKFDPDSLSFNKEAEQTLAHELFHAYDSASFRPKQKYKGCPQFRTFLETTDINKLNRKCKLLYQQFSRKNKVSDDKIFLNHMFWQKNGLRGSTPSVYENKNQTEYAAVNFQFFIFDKNYKCRRPIHYKYFAKEFNHKPFENYNCKQTKSFLVQSSNGDESIPVEVDPERVYQIQYLLASPGKGVMSSFGHSMIRLVICAPEHKNIFTQEIVPATPFGPECLRDINYHIVLSFRANVFEVTISYIGGIFGRYPSLLFALPLRTIKNEYNRDELRDLYGFPINFSEKQKKNFITNSLYMHWGYAGNYKFVTRNCASETRQLIASIEDKLEEQPLKAITPYGVLKSLQKEGLIDKKYSKKNNFKSLGRLNIMKSKSFYLLKALQNIDPTVKETNKLSERKTKKILWKYFGKEILERRKFLEDILSLRREDSTKEEDAKLKRQVYSFVLLENHIKHVLKKEFRDKIFEKSVKLKRVITEKDLEEFFEYKSQRNQNFHSSYGIPIKNEIEKIITRNKKYINTGKKFVDLYEKAIKHLEGITEERDAAIKGVEENLEAACQSGFLQVKKRPCI